MPDADRCVCCGEIIPEGRQVCPQCEGGAEDARQIDQRAKQERMMLNEREKM